MTTAGLILRLVSAAFWGLITFAGLIFDGLDLALLPFLGLFLFSLIPHRLLVHPRIVFGFSLALALLPTIWSVYVISEEWILVQPAQPKLMSMIVLVIFAWFTLLLPASLLASFLGKREARRHANAVPV